MLYVTPFWKMTRLLLPQALMAATIPGESSKSAAEVVWFLGMTHVLVIWGYAGGVKDGDQGSDFEGEALWAATLTLTVKNVNVRRKERVVLVEDKRILDLEFG
jgi:hypothetical protein